MNREFRTRRLHFAAYAIAASVLPFVRCELNGRGVDFVFEDEDGVGHEAEWAFDAGAPCPAVQLFSAVTFLRRKMDLAKQTETGEKYVESSPPVNSPAVTNPTSQAPVALAAPHTFENWKDALAAFNRRFAYIKTLDAVVRLDNLQMFTPDKFVRCQYGNWTFKSEKKVEGVEDKKEVQYLPAARRWLFSKDRNEFDGMTYAPGKPASICNGLYKELNRWRQPDMKAAKGDIGPWNELLDFMFPDAAEQRMYFEQWLAYPLQHPGTKLKTAVVLYSRRQGVGKNIMVEAVEKIYGSNAVEIGESQLYGSFNFWQKDKQFVVGDEVQGGGDKRKVIERLKILITSPTLEINEKYMPQFSIPNLANFIFLTNNPDPFYVADGDRRFWAWEIPQQEALPDSFYRRFHDWKESGAGIAALYWHLLHVDVASFNPDAKAPVTQNAQVSQTSQGAKQSVKTVLLKGRVPVKVNQ